MPELQSSSCLPMLVVGDIEHWRLIVYIEVAARLSSDLSQRGTGAAAISLGHDTVFGMLCPMGCQVLIVGVTYAEIAQVRYKQVWLVQ